MECQRCGEGVATHIASSDVLNLLVCNDCAGDALKLPRNVPGNVTVQRIVAIDTDGGDIWVEGPRFGNHA
jgi:hypothetical protein